MTLVLLVLGSWLLLNVLYVLIVIPPRRGKPMSSLARAIDTLRQFIRRHHDPP